MHKKRIAVVERERCNPSACGNYLCIRLCPVNRMGKDCITINQYDKKVNIDEELCTGCGICVKRCPFKALHVINLPEELQKNPVHRYGRNGFTLYNLAIPVFGKVIGILGKNGIGKSTIMKILANVIKPNLGKEKEATSQEIKEFFKGTEAWTFFEKLHKGEIKVSYKPQQVEKIPLAYKGKVINLLKKVDEKNMLDEIAKKLDIGEILNNDLDKLSGGELQRVAIAASLLKDAELYLLDEPTSYLDIKQRLKVAKLIRELVKENIAIVVIEHDLVVLDYLADLIYVVYGKESCYGVCSSLKSAKAGINEYLEGYLREENIRFRSTHLKFFQKFEQKKTTTEKIVEWKNIKKKLNSFLLKAREGYLNKKFVTGILGENAIGKTTFVKLLARVIKADEGDIIGNIKVSYKPQYLEANNKFVSEIIADIPPEFKNVVQQLQLDVIADRKLNELSGGELQKVAIAYALTRDADLYLLDEPTAYLDVEQRLTLAKLIRDLIQLYGKSALIVDHDLLFLDYISDDLLLFEGIPAKEGFVSGPFNLKDGMNKFLKELNITFRRDPETLRPRANKEGSVKDREQKERGEYYYL